MNEEIRDWAANLIDGAALALGVSIDYIENEQFDSILDIILSKYPPPFGEFVARKGGLTIFTDSRLRPEEVQEITELLSHCEIRLAYLDLNPKLEKTTFGKLKLGQEFYYNREYNPSPFTKIKIDNGEFIHCFGEDNGKLIRLTDDAPVEILMEIN